jgi:hypothetical protein
MSAAGKYGHWPRRLPLLYTLAIFAGAALLFVVQPLAARLVLPLLGGTPAVWTTCMLFFQAALLAGYLYAHAAPAWLGERRQAAFHLAVLLLPWLVLPLALPAGWPAPDPRLPGPWLLGVMLVSVGLPFFAVATTGPLLQRWFAATGHPAGRDPYFLYAASNLGSLLGLFAYPLLLEPLLPLRAQGWAWAAGYGLFLVLAVACAVALWRSSGPKEVVAAKGTTPPVPPPTWTRRLRWLVLAFVPSSLLLSVTLHLSTDVAAIPLLWVIPLALYLLTFVLAFARRSGVRAATVARGLPLVALVAVLVLLSEATEPAVLLVPLHLVVLFWVGLFCHTTLAEDRPPAGRLTEFYLWLAVGGALGGVFNALVAPHLFKSVAEYPLVLVLACALRPTVGETEPGGKAGLRWTDVALPVAVAAGTALLVWAVQALGLPPGPPSVAAMFAVPALVCYTFLARPLRFALGLAGLLLAAQLYRGVYGASEFRARSFFGVHRVTVDPTHTFRILVHGNTVHGQQFLDPARHDEPLNYYHRTGPVGRVFKVLGGDEPAARFKRVGVVGLGAGALCCYAHEGQEWTYYEIDPEVVRIARDPNLFTFWSDCKVRPNLVLGDARLTLARSDDRYDLLVIDAFSSDAIPAHLLTREALAVYRARLAEGGALAFNISNRYLDLERVLGDLAADGHMACLSREDRSLSDEDRRNGKSPSHWLVMAEDPKTLMKLGGWARVPSKPGRPVWTDDYFNLLSVFKWE